MERRSKVARPTPPEDGTENSPRTDKASSVSRTDKPSPISRIVYESPTLTISLTPASKAEPNPESKVEDFVVCGSGANAFILLNGQNNSGTSPVVGSVGEQSQSILGLIDPFIGPPGDQSQKRSHDESQRFSFDPSVGDKSASVWIKQNCHSSKKDDIAVSSDEEGNDMSKNDSPTISSAPTAAAEFFLYKMANETALTPPLHSFQAGDLTTEVSHAPLVPSYACDQCDYVAKSQVAVWHHLDVKHVGKQTDKQTNKQLVKQPVCYQ